ncbi:MAG: CPBP family glutamic-type intramembrane protease, partial [Actinomycetota bacterium]|nr:CPBP family glutamic-type intramembrane protease [Actinomycetota bacterium]
MDRVATIAHAILTVPFAGPAMLADIDALRDNLETIGVVVAATLAFAALTTAAIAVRARVVVVALMLWCSALVSVEGLLVAPGHLLAAQIVDAALVLLLVNFRPRSGMASPENPDQLVAAGRALALVALIRVVALGLPMRDWSTRTSLLVVAVIIALAALRVAPAVGLGLRRLIAITPAPPHLYALGSGGALGLVAYLVGAPALWPTGAGGSEIMGALAAAAVAAAVEELVFRGVVQVPLQRVAGRAGVIAASAIFASTYLDAGSAALVLTFVLAGVVFATAVARTGGLGGAVAGHVMLVVGAGAVWPTVFGRMQASALHEPQASIALALALVSATLLLIGPTPVADTFPQARRRA